MFSLDTRFPDRWFSTWDRSSLRAMLIADQICDLFPRPTIEVGNSLCEIWASVHGCCTMDRSDEAIVDDIVENRFITPIMSITLASSPDDHSGARNWDYDVADYDLGPEYDDRGDCNRGWEPVVPVIGQDDIPF